MAILGNYGVMTVDAKPTHTPTNKQARLARLEGTLTLYVFDGSSWVTIRLDAPETYSGNIIPDNVDLGTALQSLETAIEVLTQDGNHISITRGNTTEDVAPTVGEVSSPQNGDTADVLLTNGKLEKWYHNGTVWSKAFTLDYTSLQTVTDNTLYNYPDWWAGLRVPFSVANGNNNYYYDCEDDWESHIKTETPYYVSPNGNDLNDGLTPQTPKKKVSTLINQGAKLIYMLEGIYYNNTFYGEATALLNDVAIIGLGKVYVTSAEKDLIWNQSASNYSAYSPNASEIRGVVDLEDLDDEGHPYELIYVPTSADVTATDGSYTTSDNYVTVNLRGSRQASASLLVSRPNNESIRSEFNSIFIKNINFIQFNLSLGGISGTNSEFKGYLKNIYNPIGVRSDVSSAFSNSIHFLLFKEAVVQDSYIRHGRRDNINYSGFIANSNSLALEVRVTSTDSGYKDTNVNNQCSTAHTSIKTLRVDSSYSNGTNTTIADVDGGTQSILLGCEISSLESYSTRPLVLSSADLYGCKIYNQGTIVEQDGSYGVTINKSYVNANITTTGNVVINDQ